MKIIEIGICVDNKDPRGFGRIRARSIDEQDSTRANAIPLWEQWTKDDPFVYSPFLPNHINIIPQIQQAVKIIRYDDAKALQNQEYVPGPFTSPHNFNYQNELTQLTETSYGQRAEKTPAIKSFTGDKKVYDDGFLRAESVGSLPKLNDIALSGNYGSDIILTEHGVQLRAGKLMDKTNANSDQKDDLEKYPMYSKKHSKISLKKFPTTVKLDTKIVQETTIPRTDIKHILEYSLDSLTAPTQVTLTLFRVDRSEGEKYKTDVFGLNSELTTGSTTSIFTQTITLETTGVNNRLQEAYILTRDFISKLDRENMNVIDPSLPETSPHPIFFRPTNSLRVQENSKQYLDNINFANRLVTFGLIYSKSSITVPPVTKNIEIPYLKEISDTDQTFAAITADQIFNLSTVVAGTDGKQIDFAALNKYEYTQEDYLKKILPNTYSTVRGEKLIEILELIVLILLNHTHGIVTPPKYFKATIDQLTSLISKAKQDMVNSSIRIN